MSSFANLKRNSTSNLDKLKKAAESSGSSNFSNDEDKYWKCEVDKTGNGYAIIRFLPAPSQDGDDGLPWVKFFDHGFQGPGGWYIEKSLTTLGKDDPVSQYNSELWNSGIESNKEIARKQKRRLHYVSNVYVVKDPKHPENEGKVFLYKYGKKIMEKLTTAMNPQFEDDSPVDPFDLSEFDTAGPLLDDDDALEGVWKSEHSLAEIIDAKNFKSYDDLKKKLDKVLGITSPTVSRGNTFEAVKQQKIQDKESEIDTSLLEDDEDADFFKNLLDDDE